MRERLLRLLALLLASAVADPRHPVFQSLAERLAPAADRDQRTPPRQADRERHA